MELLKGDKNGHGKPGGAPEVQRVPITAEQVQNNDIGALNQASETIREMLRAHAVGKNPNVDFMGRCISALKEAGEATTQRVLLRKVFAEESRAEEARQAEAEPKLVTG